MTKRATWLPLIGLSVIGAVALVAWAADEVQVTHDASHYDTQPHPLPDETPGRVILTWSHQDGGTPYQDHDVWIDTSLDILPPTSAILEPQEGQFISDTTYLVSGVATDTVSGVAGVAISVDGGPWQAAEGQASWTYLWEAYDEGAHNLRSRATDVAGHVEEPGLGVTVTVDSTPPELVASSPVSGAIGVSLTAPVMLRFSEPVLHDTLGYSMAPDPGGWHVLWNVGWTEAYLSHDGLLPGQTYTFTVSQARDRARNPVAPAQWTFTTMSVEKHHHVYLPLLIKGE